MTDDTSKRDSRDRDRINVHEDRFNLKGDRRKFAISEETPNCKIGSDGGMTAPAQFLYNGHHVNIVPPDSEHVIGFFWQIKIDGVLQRELLFSSSRVAADQAKRLIDQDKERIDAL